MSSRRKRMVVMAATAALALSVGFAQAAQADTAPELSCGNTEPGPCSQTAHFSDVNEADTPAESAGPSCPSFLTVDFATIVGTGNGVEHVTVNKAQDFWFTSTFTGVVTITLYPPSSASVDKDGNVTIIGSPDPNVPAFTGKLTEWFGASGNRQSFVFHDTFHFSGTAANGQTISVHDVGHASWTPGTDPNGPPHTGFERLTCR